MKLFMVNMAILLWFNSYPIGNETPLIFPIPSDIQIHEGKFNVDKTTGLQNSHLLPGDIKTGNKMFHLTSAGNKNAIVVGDEIKSAKVIQVNKDVSSIIFLQACAKEALNDKAYGIIYNFDDTAEPLGWYEIVYEDAMVETIPIRYGVNILDWRWRQRIMADEKEKGKYSQSKYAYNARAVDCAKDNSDPITFFSFEWKNPRFGKKIKEVNLWSVNYKKGNENSIILLAVNIAGNEKMTNAKGTEAQ